MSISFARLAPMAAKLGCSSLIAAALLPIAPLAAQEEPIRPGEAVVTRFSGTTSTQSGDTPVINLDGTVVSIVDLRAPGQPPEGQHWIDEPQRKAVTARQVGQVFGVTLDDATPPNVYLAATSAFGLHRTEDNAQWMPGMWGSGGPGAVYKLDAANGYAPRLLSKVTLGGRENGGPGLGNIAYDGARKQLFVSDLETGMIHRLRAADGASLDQYDHGVQGRAKFVDAATGAAKQLPQIAFDPASRARINDCPSGFETSPQCWNFAASGRRVWGIAVHRNPEKNETRLYYAVWSGPAFGQAGWNQADEDDKRNAVWSVRLGPEGGFDPADVRREFQLPDFFVKPQDIARAGYSQPVSDITFSACGPRPVMLLAERGGIRNLGLGEPDAFAHPYEARALRYELDQAGNWRPVGRYDVGFYDRRKEGQPFLRANCAGGIAFGPSYDQSAWTADTSKPDEFVWITGNALCSADGPCNLPVGATADQPDAGGAAQPAAAASTEAVPDDSEVHGLQGVAASAFAEVAPEAAFAASAPDAAADAGLHQSYLIDTDVNVDSAGGLIEEELVRNDQTRIGDVAVYQVCAPPAGYPQAMLLAPIATGAAETPVLVGHPAAVSHARIASHGRESSHYRFGSHNPYWSHNRFASHNLRWSHSRIGSHSRLRSHYRVGSHTRQQSHRRSASHTRAISHWRTGSHNQRLSHSRFRSHNPALSHQRIGSHNLRLSHQRLGSHVTNLSHSRLGSHTRALSHVRIGSHNLRLSHAQFGSHSTAQSGRNPPHKITASHTRTGSHTRARSNAHSRTQSQGHDRLRSQVKSVHSQSASHNRRGSHARALSQRKPPSTRPPTRHPRATPSRPRPPRAAPTRQRPPRAAPTRQRVPRAAPTRQRAPRAAPTRQRAPRAAPQQRRPQAQQPRRSQPQRSTPQRRGRN